MFQGAIGLGDDEHHPRIPGAMSAAPNPKNFTKWLSCLHVRNCHSGSLRDYWLSELPMLMPPRRSCSKLLPGSLSAILDSSFFAHASRLRWRQRNKTPTKLQTRSGKSRLHISSAVLVFRRFAAPAKWQIREDSMKTHLSKGGTHSALHRKSPALIASYALMLAVHATLLPSFAFAATADCPPLSLPTLAGPSWAEDAAYEMTVSDIGEGQLAVRVVGDVLKLDSAGFASLIRASGRAPSNVKKIILDAREVRIFEPISLQSGIILINAQSVAFEGRGALILTKLPSNQSEGLEINALEMDIRSSLPTPFQISLNDETQRIVALNIGAVRTNSGTLTGLEASSALWRHSTNYDGAVPQKFPSGWQVNIGDRGAESAITRMRGTVAWPAYVAYKLRKHHTFAPFDPKNQEELSTKISMYRPLLEQLEASDALLSFDAVNGLIAENIDMRGFGPAHVPSEDLVVALGRFKTDVAKAKAQFDRLNSIIISAYQQPKLDDKAIEKARDRIKSLTEAQVKHRQEVNTIFTTLAGLQASETEVRKHITDEVEQSRKQLEDLKKRDANLANIKAVTTVVAVGASFVGTPAVGAAIATGVNTAGALVYSHNAGTPVNVELLTTIGQKNADLYSQISGARAAWEKHSSNLDILKAVFDGKQITPEGEKSPLTRTAAAKRSADSAGDFAGKVNAVLNAIGSMPKPDLIELNEMEKQNSALQQHLITMGTLQKQIAEQNLKLAKAKTALVADGSALSETQAVEQVLLDLKPSNDQEVLRWKTAALGMWRRDLQLLYRDAMDLRRSLFLESWKLPNLPPDVQRYPEEITAYLAAGRYSPETPGANTPMTLTKEFLDSEVDRHILVLTAIGNAVDHAWEDYKSERASGAQPYSDPIEFSNNPGASEEPRLFIEQLNAQISRQVIAPESREVSQLPLLIPLNMPIKPPLDLPERLLKVGVDDVEFSNPESLSAKQIAFDVWTRLAGELRRGDTCWYVDLAIPGGADSVPRRINLDDLAELKAGDDLPVSFADLQKSRTSPPARTLYFMSVVVGGFEQDTNWKNIPKITKLRFWRRIVQ